MIHKIILIISFILSQSISSAKENDETNRININSYGFQKSVTFNFFGFIPSSGVISSSTNNIAIINSRTDDFSSLLFVAPSGCRIGSGYIQESNTYMVVNSQEYISNSQIDPRPFIQNGGATVLLRFKGLSTVNYGTVQCKSAGILIFTY